MERRTMRLALHAGWLAGLACAAARLGAWNAAGLVLPGALLALFAIALQRPLHALGVGAAGRIGGWLLMLSGLAFAAGAAWPLRWEDLDGLDSKLHVATSMLAWLAWLPSAVLLPLALRRHRHWRVAAVAGPLLAVAGIAGLGLAAYFAWPALLAWRALSRAAASGPGSSPPARR